MHKLVTGLALIGAISLSACAKQEPITEEELQRTTETLEVASDAPAIPAPPANSETLTESEKPDGEGPDLQAMAFIEADGVVEPGLGCSFVTSADETLFFASAPSKANSTAKAAVKIKNAIMPLNAEGLGGYNALEKGGVYSGSGLTLTIERAEGEGETVARESLQWPASLKISIAEGGSSIYENGRYVCGS